MNKTPEQKLTEKGLIRKIKSALHLVGQEAISHALILYYTLRAPNTPIWCRTVILGSLGYFISLVDGVPDLTPILGYTDDISVMAAAVAALSQYITPEIKEQAAKKTDEILKNNKQ